MHIRPIILPLTFLVLASTASAAPQESDLSVYGKLGGLGASIGIGKAINEQFSIRAGIAGGGSYKKDKNISGIDYEAKFKPGTSLEVLADWYPLESSGFRLTGGLLLGQQAKVELKGKQSGQGNYSINDRSYSAATVGDLRGTVKTNSVKPYLGIGWDSDRPGKRGWHFVSDAGVLFLGKGKTTLDAGGAANNAALRADLDAERSQLSSKFKNNAALVLSVGASYSF